MIRASIKLAALLIWVILLYPIVWLATKTNKPALSNGARRFACVGILWICEIRVHKNGQLSDMRPLLVISNHLSYADIPILGSLAQFRFTPKSDIASWPLISNICRMTRCVFIDRKPDRVQEASGAVHAALAQGDMVVLFPEATTGNGIHLVDFKSSMFHLAGADFEGRPLNIQPIAITYKAVRRLPISSTQWPSIAWYGDMKLAPHILEFLALGPIDVEVSFLPAIDSKQYSDRKQLAKYCQHIIANRISDAKKEKLTSYVKRFSLPFAVSKSKP